eukprot:gene13761-biopygen3568
MPTSTRWGTPTFSSSRLVADCGLWASTTKRRRGQRCVDTRQRVPAESAGLDHSAKLRCAASRFSKMQDDGAAQHGGENCRMRDMRHEGLRRSSAKSAHDSPMASPRGCGSPTRKSPKQSPQREPLLTAGSWNTEGGVII